MVTGGAAVRAVAGGRWRPPVLPMFGLMLLLGVTACAVPPPDRDAPPWHTFGVRAGGAVLGEIDTNLRLDSNLLGRGTELDFEDDLGFSKSTEVGRVDAFWRISRRHRIDFSYFDIERSADRTLSRQIQFGETVFPVSANVTSTFDTEIFKGSYQLTAWAEDTWEVRASVGMHWMRLSAGIESAGLSLNETFSEDAPLPMVGLHAEWQFADRWRLLGSSELFYVDLQDVGDAEKLEGGIFDNVLSVEWDMLDFAGVGVGYNFFLLNADVGSDALSLSGEYRYHGLLIYGRVFL